MKITELKAGEEYAARLFPKHPHLVSHIRLLDTNKTERRTYSGGWGSGSKVTQALPAVSIQRDGVEHPIGSGVLPRHIFSTWEEYRPTAEVKWAEEDRREMFLAQADAQFAVVDLGRCIVVRWTPEQMSSEPEAPMDMATIQLAGVVVDRETATKQANELMRIFKSRFVGLAMGTLREATV